MKFPIEKLAIIVGQLFDMSGDTRLSSEEQATAYRTANQLHSYSEVLAQKQFDSTAAGYDAAIERMNQISEDLAKAANHIENLVGAVNNAASLVGAIEGLLKTAASFGSSTAER